MKSHPGLGLALIAVSLAFGGWARQAVSADARARTAARPDLPNGFIVEGPLPEGFPPPAEVGMVVEKTYPLCRTFSAEGNQAFSRCFVYLVLHKHEMTAPVIMDYKHRDTEKKPTARGELSFLDVQRMHFVLENPSLDQPKKEGFVEVADLPKMRVLSIAHQGQLSAEVLKKAEASLTAEIGRRPGLRAAGPPRVLGYNSPMVPKDRSYWELQIPVESKPADAAESPKA